MNDSDDNPRFVLTVRLMFDSHDDAKYMAERIEDITGAAMSSEYSIEEV
jgi:hypothetical protein